MPTWDQIEDWIENQRYSAAREGAAERLATLDPDDDAVEWTRTLAKIAQLDLGLHGYEKAVRELRGAEWPRDPVSRAGLELLYAHSLRTYHGAYRWEIDQRERVAEGGEIDLRRWTTPQISAEIDAAFERLWAARATWGSRPLGELEEFVEPDRFPVGIRGTLRDVVAYLWVEKLVDSSLWEPDETALYRVPLDGLLARLSAGRSIDEAAVADRVHPLERV